MPIPETFTTEALDAALLREIVAEIPNSGYWDQLMIADSLAKRWRSPEGLSITEVYDKVQEVRKKYDRQVGAFVEKLNKLQNKMKHATQQEGWDFDDANSILRDSIVAQYGYDSYDDGTWVQSNY